MVLTSPVSYLGDDCILMHLLDVFPYDCAGVLRYPYPSIVRPAFPLRPPGTVGAVPLISRPPMLGVRPPIITSIVRPPILPVFAPVEKPQTTVYVGKISSTVENDFMLSLLQVKFGVHY